jgi:perosamine synthetase
MPSVTLGCAEIDDLARRNIQQVLDTGRLSPGPFCKQFEEDFAAKHTCRFGLFSNSGTSALRTAVAALAEIHNWAPGDEVIVPAITFVATSNVVIDRGFTPVFCDVDPTTYNIDPAKIEACITPRTRAIMPVHLMGLPCEMGRIMPIVKKHKLRVIEDTCETMGVRCDGRYVGSFGDAGCFSTYMAHLLTTGVGGVTTTNDPEVAELVRSLLNHGRDGIYIRIDDSKGKTGAALKEVVERRFRFIRPGYSFRATEFEAAIGLAQLVRLDQIIAARQRAAAHILKGLASVERYIQLPTIPANREHAFMMFPLTVREQYSAKLPKSDFMLYLEERGIETREILPLINQPFYVKRFGDLESKFPVARWINHNGLYVGCHQQLTVEELDYLIATVKDFVRSKGLDC